MPCRLKSAVIRVALGISFVLLVGAVMTAQDIKTNLPGTDFSKYNIAKAGIRVHHLSG
jgi:hypothetical protein